MKSEAAARRITLAQNRSRSEVRKPCHACPKQGLCHKGWKFFYGRTWLSLAKSLSEQLFARGSELGRSVRWSFRPDFHDFEIVGIAEDARLVAACSSDFPRASCRLLRRPVFCFSLWLSSPVTSPRAVLRASSPSAPSEPAVGNRDRPRKATRNIFLRQPRYRAKPFRHPAN